MIVSDSLRDFQGFFGGSFGDSLGILWDFWDRQGFKVRQRALCNATVTMNRRFELTSASSTLQAAPLFDLADEDIDDVDDAQSTHRLERQTTVEQTDSENATVTSHLSLPHFTLNRHQVLLS